MVEFLFVIVLFLMTLFGMFETCRLLLSYTTLANASRVAVRYATTHGDSNNSSSYIATADEIRDIVRDFTAGSLIDENQVTVTTTWPSSSANPGDEVRVRVSYPYQPFVLLPMSTTLATQTAGIVTF